MTLLLITFLGGVLTILSPCILPVLPFVFARADRPFLTSTAPMLLGMAVTFAAVASLAAVGGSWVVQLNQAGRIAALVLLIVFGLMLLFPQIADRVTRPVVAFGNRLSARADAEAGHGNQIGASLLIGIAVGFLWAPCAGPILGLVLTTAALNGASFDTTLLLLAYALGAAVSLAIALFAGGKVFAALKKSLGAGEWVRRGLGVAVLIGAGAIALGLDTGFLTQVSLGGSTTQLEQGLVDQIPAADRPGSVLADNSAMMMAPDANNSAMTGPTSSTSPSMMMMGPAGGSTELPIEGAMPPLEGGVAWLNSSPLTAEQLRGKVVLVDFWTYSCINCLRALPYVRGWAEKYRDAGLVVVGVHSPEFAFERDEGNVRRAVSNLDITYPVAIDSDLKIWRAFRNSYWPAHYFIDARGNILHHHFGEGDYDQSERVIKSLLAEAGAAEVPRGLVDPEATGVGEAPALDTLKSPETYIGYKRRENFASPQTQRETVTAFTLPASLTLNQWGLQGQWNVRDERADLEKAGGAISFRFHARDLHLVLGASEAGKRVRFRVTVDGKPLGENHGVDTDAGGNGVVTDQRLYQLVRGGAGTDRTFRIQFLDPGVSAFAFTFG